jgi:hypothetical protein
MRDLNLSAHVAPSTMDADTLNKLKGHIPEVFLRGVGVPDAFIAYASHSSDSPLSSILA